MNFGIMFATHWRACSDRPQKTTSCLIFYQDGTIISGKYHHDPEFDHGGFFSSMKEFDKEFPSTPEFWMPMPRSPY